jgi:signal transduction histidine kinase
MLKTINSKFIVLTIIFILLSVGIPTAFLIIQFRANFEQRSIIMLESTLDVIYSWILNEMHMGQQKNVQHIVDKISSNRAVEHLRIFNADSMILHASDSSEIGQNITFLSPKHIDFDFINIKQVKLQRDNQIYSISRPIFNTRFCQSCHGTDPVVAYIDVDTDLTQAERFFYTGSTHMIFLGITIIIVLFLGFYLLFNFYINRPLARFRRALDAVEQGNLDIHLPAQNTDEIGILEGHFNTMVKNLKSSNKKIEEMHFEQLQRADKLVTLGELAAEMAHEINNPAAIIMSRVDYLQLQSMRDDKLKQYEEDMDVIINQVQKVSNITRSILKYSKKRPKQFSRINLQHIVEESLNILEPRLIKRKINMNKQYTDDQPFISGDAQQIDQLITNLVNNAIDAMDESGMLTIRISHDSTEQIRLEIIDTGHGMDADTKNQIFSPFFTTKTAGKGTGLGLYIVKNIVNNHSATILCESELDKGTTFTIVFREDGQSV